MNALPAIGTRVEVHFRSGQGKRKILASQNGVLFYPQSSKWDEKPKPEEWWEVELLERLPHAPPSFLVGPVRKLEPPAIPADGLQINQEVEVVFKAGHSGDPFANYSSGARRQMIFPERDRWKEPPQPGITYRVKITRCADPRRGIFHAAYMRRVANLQHLVPGDVVPVTWRADSRRGVRGTIDSTNIDVCLDLRGGEWRKAVPLPKSQWRVRLLSYSARDNAWLADSVEWKSGPRIPKYDSRKSGFPIVSFVLDQSGNPIGFLDGTIAFPHSKWNHRPGYGESWEVSVNSRLERSMFVTGLHKIAPR